MRRIIFQLSGFYSKISVQRVWPCPGLQSLMSSLNPTGPAVVLESSETYVRISSYDSISTPGCKQKTNQLCASSRIGGLPPLLVGSASLRERRSTVSGSRFRVQGFSVSGQGLGARAWGLGFRVSGRGLTG